MTIGMLWFDNNSKTSLTEKIAGAIRYYINKYGQLPNRCVVHPSMLPANSPDTAQIVIDGKAHPVTIAISRQVLPNHFWIGVHTD